MTKHVTYENDFLWICQIFWYDLYLYALIRCHIATFENGQFSRWRCQYEFFDIEYSQLLLYLGKTEFHVFQCRNRLNNSFFMSDSPIWRTYYSLLVTVDDKEFYWILGRIWLENNGFLSSDTTILRKLSYTVRSGFFLAETLRTWKIEKKFLTPRHSVPVNIKFKNKWFLRRIYTVW